MMPPGVKVFEQLAIDVEKPAMLEVSERIGLISLEQLLWRPQLQPANVEQTRDHRRAAAVHADEANYPGLSHFRGSSIGKNTNR